MQVVVQSQKTEALRPMTALLQKNFSYLDAYANKSIPVSNPFKTYKPLKSKKKGNESLRSQTSHELRMPESL